MESRRPDLKAEGRPAGIDCAEGSCSMRVGARIRSNAMPLVRNRPYRLTSFDGIGCLGAVSHRPLESRGTLEPHRRTHDAEGWPPFVSKAPSGDHTSRTSDRAFSVTIDVPSPGPIARDPRRYGFPCEKQRRLCAGLGNVSRKMRRH